MLKNNFNVIMIFIEYIKRVGEKRLNARLEMDVHQALANVSRSIELSPKLDELSQARMDKHVH